MDAIEAAYQDGFAQGQRDMADQLAKLGTVALLKAKLRMFLGRPVDIVEDSGVESADEPEASAPERERGVLVFDAGTVIGEGLKITGVVGLDITRADDEATRVQLGQANLDAANKGSQS
jgi:hypothetical protein